jgi:Fic family protein
VRREGLCHRIRESLVRYAPPFEAHYGVIPPPPPRDMLDLSSILDRHVPGLTALVLIKERSALGPAAHSWPITRILIRREAVASSAIEGTHSTLDELLSVEETGDGEAREAARQVRDYALSLERCVPLAMERGPSLFDLDLISALHRDVMQDDRHYMDTPGVLRQRTVWIGGRDIAHSTYNPPPHDRVPELLDQTIDYLRADDMHVIHQSLLVRMSLAHAHFEAVHPFRDGNGRTGRLLLPLMMAAEQAPPLYLSPAIEARKDAYYSALKAAQQQLDFLPLIAFMSEAVKETVDELMRTLEALTRLQEDWVGLRAFRSDAAARRLQAHLISYPIITIHRAAELLGVSFTAASSAVSQLEEIGVLEERTGFARNRRFAAPAVLAILNRPFGASIAGELP